ncbi:hypothetical protein AB205_0123900, partial [Aquarana catesbeiana]
CAQPIALGCAPPKLQHIYAFDIFTGLFPALHPETMGGRGSQGAHRGTRATEGRGTGKGGMAGGWHILVQIPPLNVDERERRRSLLSASAGGKYRSVPLNSTPAASLVQVLRVSKEGFRFTCHLPVLGRLPTTGLGCTQAHLEHPLRMPMPIYLNGNMGQVHVHAHGYPETCREVSPSMEYT